MARSRRMRHASAFSAVLLDEEPMQQSHRLPRMGTSALRSLNAMHSPLRLLRAAYATP